MCKHNLISFNYSKGEECTTLEHADQILRIMTEKAEREISPPPASPSQIRESGVGGRKSGSSRNTIFDHHSLTVTGVAMWSTI